MERVVHELFGVSFYAVLKRTAINANNSSEDEDEQSEGVKDEEKVSLEKYIILTGLLIFALENKTVFLK